MTLAPGSKLGPYEVVSLLGAGGMGEVWKARDARLGREVAIKVLPENFLEGEERKQRFEREAKLLASLNHPGIATLYSFEEIPGSPGSPPRHILVMELLEGETLRERLRAGPLPPRRAVDLAVQMAKALAAAHENAIVHRDLKPENVFLTKDSRVKILDFGLAKLTRREAAVEKLTEAGTLSVLTDAGAVFGTAGYMSPEQVRGEPVDARSDIFSFGTIVYEMLSGKNPFRAATTAETMTAILKEDPPEISASQPSASPALERIARRCLEKNAEQRFQSARDVGFALEALSGSASKDTVAAPNKAGGFLPRRPFAVLAASVLLAAALGFLGGKEFMPSALPTFKRLTFRRGSNQSARFAPDGQTVVYGAAWDGGPIRAYSTGLSGPESRPLDLPNADVVAVSRSGELAILLNRNDGGVPLNTGTLARVPLAGGAPRELLRNVYDADWSPDGKELAVVRRDGTLSQLEFPIGTMLYRGAFYRARVSPDGKLVAFLENAVGLCVVDRAGKKRQLTDWRMRFPIGGVAWSPKGDEVWYAGSEGIGDSLYAVTLSGKQRVVARFPSFAVLQDISPGGRVLVTLGELRSGIIGLPPGETRERDLSWLDYPSIVVLSKDGTTLLFHESGEGVRGTRTLYLRRTDGLSPPVRLGEGSGEALSDDLKWVLAMRKGVKAEWLLWPTGAGESRVVRGSDLELEGGEFFPDGKRLLLEGRQPGRPARLFVMDLPDGEPRPLTPEGIVFLNGQAGVSPDGRSVAAKGPNGEILIFGADGGEPRTLPGPWESRVGPWSADGRSFYVSERQGTVIKVFRRDLASGRREPVREITPSDPAGVFAITSLLSQDGASYVYAYWRHLSNLYVVDGLK